MKILLLANSFPRLKNEATGVYNYRLVKQFKEMGEDIFVAYFRVWLPGRKIISTYIYDEIKVYQICLPIILTNKYFNSLFRYNILICRIFGKLFLEKELQVCDIIHSVDICSNGIIAGYWANKFKKPHVSQAIGSDVNYNLKKIVKGNNYSKWLKNINGIITNSKNLEIQIRAIFPYYYELKTIYRGINIVPNTDKHRENGKEKGICFLYIGGFASKDTLNKGNNTKGGATLTQAWQMVERELIKTNAVLFMGGPRSNKKFLLSWRNNLNYPNRVKIIGNLTPTRVKYFMQISDVIIIPSMKEGLPNVLLESYANRRPVIGSDAGGNPEIILHGKTGFVFKCGDSNALSKLLMQAASDKKKIEIMGMNGYNHAKDYFNAVNYGPNLKLFYENTIIKYSLYKKS